MKQTKGITLIALVITVIVLLILAGVSINFLFGNEGILSKTQTAVDKYKKAQENEQTLIAKVENEINTYVSGDRQVPVEDFTTNLVYKLNLNNLSSQSGVTINGSGVTVSNDKKYVSFKDGSYIQVGEDTIDPTGEYRTLENTTMCCWYRTTSSYDKGAPIIALGESSLWLKHNVHFFHLTNDYIGSGQGFGSIKKYVDPSNTRDGNWHFIAAVYSNGNSLTFYYDGVPFTANESGQNYTNSNMFLTIASNLDDTTSMPYTGDLSDIRIYKAALTESQIKQIFEYGKCQYGTVLN